MAWTYMCRVDDIDEEDVMRVDHDGSPYAVYRTEKGVFTSDGMCTHEDADLSDGLVMDNVIECPLHQGRFDIPSGRALSPPVCINLQTYDTKVEDGYVYAWL